MKTDRITVSQDAFNVGIYCEMCGDLVARSVHVHEHIARDRAWAEAEASGCWVKRDTYCGRNITAFLCGACLRAAVWAFHKKAEEAGEDAKR